MENAAQSDFLNTVLTAVLAFAAPSKSLDNISPPAQR
jgi:hypothetical protein